ncbi:hypothetical protein EDC04DRAFT_2802531 [Pisolithus marmoratus]|nr:hypothetical protein EDC04DRAFT_2802531 [Pisolithus marmoratus]
MGVCVTLLPAAALAHGWVSRDAMRTVIVQVVGEMEALKCLAAQHSSRCVRQQMSTSNARGVQSTCFSTWLPNSITTGAHV